ncbi:glycosyltransferase [Bradyrhizobium sp. AZCC 2289]|uniref:glycosyltransferase n=1 Tax=Bradyrhizobium sp. AZCC 2289 TaxID=3117026 RepID=UPI002FF1922C
MKFAFFVHYFPPLNSTGSRRVESFAKYLSRSGHEIVVVSTGKSTRDGPLTEAVPPYIRLYEINSFGRVAKSSGETDRADTQRASSKKRIHWTRRVKQKLMRLFGQVLDPRIGFPFGIRSRNLDTRVVTELASADIFVSSFPPWPAHLAALFAQRRFGKPWIADYRDQFSGNHIMNGGWLSDRLELWIDRALLRRATAVTVISGPMKAYYDDMHPCVECIENGYDGEIFDSAHASLVSSRKSGTTVLRYLGTITRDRIPVSLLAALERLAAVAPQGEPPFRVEFLGDTRLLEDYVRLRHPNLLKGWLAFIPAIPYAKSIEAMLSADALFFIETSDLSNLSARGVLTTKLFEYLASGRQIIAEIDNATLTASYIRQASPIHVVSRDVDTLAAALRKLCPDTIKIEDNPFVASLSRERKAQQFEQFALKVVRRELGPR